VTADDDAEKRRLRLKMLRAFAEAVPHNRALGIAIVEVGDGFARYKLPYAEQLVGDPDSGVLHGGAVTALLDACCGSAVFNALPTPQPVATLDLRIDYLGPATPGSDVYAAAECYKVTRNIGFARAVAYQEDETSPIASAVATFMIATKVGTAGMKP